MRQGLILDRAQAFDTKHMGLKWVSMLQESLFILIPLFLVVVVAAIVSNIAVGGFNWSTKPLEPKLSKLNPIKGLKNIFSVNGLAEPGQSHFENSGVGWGGLPVVDAGSGRVHPAVSHAA